MLVQDLMVRNVATISYMATICEAMQSMKVLQVKSLVVKRRDPHDVYGISTQAHVKQAASMMVNMNLRRLLAMDGNELAGIITMNDIVSAILHMAEIEPSST